MLDLPTLIHDCAPMATPAIVEAIIRTESGFDPLAIHVNGNVQLRVPPKDAAQAATWSGWLIDKGYSVDMGLMQVNSRNLASLSLTPAAVFDPCQNIKAGAAILMEQYGRSSRAAGPGPQALLQAISAYNTGTFKGGFRNGYVGRVVMNVSGGKASRENLFQTVDLTCLLTHCADHAAHVIKLSPYTADSAVAGFDAISP